MTTHLPVDYYEPLWQQAQQEEIGIEVTVEPEDQSRFVNDLYACRRETGGYEDLMIFQPLPEGTIFIAKKAVELPE